MRPGIPPATPAPRRSTGRPTLFPADGIALDQAGQYRCWQARTGKTLYRLPVAKLVDAALSDDALAAAVETVGESGVADGLWMMPSTAAMSPAPRTTRCIGASRTAAWSWWRATTTCAGPTAWRKGRMARSAHQLAHPGHGAVPPGRQRPHRSLWVVEVVALRGSGWTPPPRRRLMPPARSKEAPAWIIVTSAAAA